MGDKPAADGHQDDAEGHAPSVDALLAAARAQRRGDLTRGLALAQAAWDAAVADGYVSEQVEAGRLRVMFHLRRGEFTEVLALGERVLPLQRTLGNGPALCELLRWLTLAAADLGEFEAALSTANEGIACARELGDPQAVSLALNVLGACFERMGDPWQSERLMSQAAALVHGQPSVMSLVATHNNLATVALGTYHLLANSGHERECAEALERALRHAETVRPHAVALDDPYPIALSDGNRGEVLLHLGRLDEAENLLQLALALNEQCGFLVLAWRVRCSLAELALARGRAREAFAALQDLKAQTAGRKLGSTALRIEHAAYRAAKALADNDAALEHLERYQALERSRSVAQLTAQARFFVTRLEAEQALGAITGPAGHAGTPAPDDPQHLLQRDPLTGLGNRRCLESNMPALVRAAERRGAPLTLALVEVDRYADVAAQHGPAVAERVLQALARMLTDNTRDRDLLLRCEDRADGAEILVALPDTGPDRAFEVCERLRQAVEIYPWRELAAGLDVTISIGLANAPPYATDLLIARAESAMYRAKHLGRNRVALA